MGKKIETSKLITWVFIVFYILTLSMSAILTVFGYDISFVIDYLHQIMIIIIVSYFGKSGIENIQKIRNSNQIDNYERGDV